MTWLIRSYSNSIWHVSNIAIGRKRDELLIDFRTFTVDDLYHIMIISCIFKPLLISIIVALIELWQRLTNSGDKMSGHRQSNTLMVTVRSAETLVVEFFICTYDLYILCIHISGCFSVTQSLGYHKSSFRSLREMFSLLKLTYTLYFTLFFSARCCYHT